uniref:Aha1 domain-containing protein n=1 Tax=Myxococcus virescens TaxID=83456 RepID=A0A7D5SMC9_9BACT|nr:Aha1 domain-containing protein [Myxococcus virescens]
MKRNEPARLLASDTVRIERLLPGPIERVWAYLTESEKRRLWLAGGLTETKVGGKVELMFRHSELSEKAGAPPPRHADKEKGHLNVGRVTACEPPHVFAYTWAENHGDPSEVRFELAEREDGVLLTVTHVRLDSRDTRRSVAGGWHTHLDLLVDRLNGQPSPNFWEAYERAHAEYVTRPGFE